MSESILRQLDVRRGLLLRTARWMAIVAPIVIGGLNVSQVQAQSPAPQLPTFEVATIKPSNPDRAGKGIVLKGRQLATLNTSVNDLIMFAYGLNTRQIVEGSAGHNSALYDILAQPEGHNRPSADDLKLMVQQLLVDRFKLKFHHEQRELSAYALVVGKDGPKLEKNNDDPDGSPRLIFRGLGVLPARNATMSDLAGVMQTTVLDRPVVDQTGIKGRYNFLLTWTPDESQFSGLGIRVQVPSDDTNSPPNLFTAIQEQLGLKLKPTKALVDVMVIDHIENPSEN